MKRLVACYIVALLGVTILGAAFYIVLVAGSSRQSAIVWTVGTFCLSAAFVGAITTSSKIHANIFYGVIIAGIVILGLGITLLIHLETQDVDYGHAIPILELLTVGLLGMLVAAMIIRYGSYFTSYFVIGAIGILALCAGLYLLVSMSYHERAYIAIGTGCVCLLIASVGPLFLKKRVQQETRKQSNYWRGA